MDFDDPKSNKPNIGSARELARKIIKDLAIEKPPICLKMIADHLKKKFDLSILPFPFTEKVSGVMFIEDKSATIGYNEFHHDHRQRFTIAHEMAHLIMRHKCEKKSDDYREVEANTFAAELLIPLKFLKVDFKSNPNIKFLADKYIVSEQAMTIHLMSCRLIK